MRFSPASALSQVHFLQGLCDLLCSVPHCLLTRTATGTPLINYSCTLQYIPNPSVSIRLSVHSTFTWPSLHLTSELEPFLRVIQNQRADPECTGRLCSCRGLQPQPLNPESEAERLHNPNWGSAPYFLFIIFIIIMWSIVSGMSLQRSGSVMVGTQSYTLRLSSQNRLSLSRAGSFHGFALGLWNKKE